MAEKSKRPTVPSRGLKIQVTQAIIDRAEAKDSNHCMIADAIKAARPDVKAVSVDMSTIRFTDPVKRQRYVYLTPPRAQLALVLFDQGEHAEPFEIQMRMPVQVVPMAERKTQPDGTIKRTSLAKQGIAKTGSGSRRPVVLGGKLPPKDELNVGGSGRPNKNIAAAEQRAVTAKVAREAAEAARKAAGRGGSKPGTEVPRTRTVTKAQAEKAAADRAKGLPATEHSNITMTNRRHVREFGLKQLVR